MRFLVRFFVWGGRKGFFSGVFDRGFEKVVDRVFKRGLYYKVFDGAFNGGLTEFSKQVLTSLLKMVSTKFVLARFLTWFMKRFLTEAFDNFQRCYKLMSFGLKSKAKFENFLSLIVIRCIF